MSKRRSGCAGSATARVTFFDMLGPRDPIVRARAIQSGLLSDEHRAAADGIRALDAQAAADQKRFGAGELRPAAAQRIGKPVRGASRVIAKHEHQAPARPQHAKDLAAGRFRLAARTGSSEARRRHRTARRPTAAARRCPAADRRGPPQRRPRDAPTRRRASSASDRCRRRERPGQTRAASRSGVPFRIRSRGSARPASEPGAQRPAHTRARSAAPSRAPKIRPSTPCGCIGRRAKPAALGRGHASEPSSLGPKTSRPTTTAPIAADQHGARRHVLRALDERMELRRRDVAQRLERGVERFRRPHRDDRQHHRDPFDAVDAQREARSDGGQRRRGVDPRVVLRRERDPDAAQGVSEAADPRADAESLQPGAPRIAATRSAADPGRRCCRLDPRR